MAMHDELTLYYSPGCGFCWRVLAALERLGVDLPTRNVWTDLVARREIRAGTGRATVPVLRIRGEGTDEWMFESADIIAFLTDRFSD